MNQSFGGAFLIKIALIFLCTYIFILGFAMNYAKVFTMKNKIVTLIEQYEGYDERDSALMQDIRYQADKLNYKGLLGDQASNCDNTQNLDLYCIKMESASHNMTYYKVTAFIRFEIPLFKDLAAGIIPVSGETRYLYNF